MDEGDEPDIDGDVTCEGGKEPPSSALSTMNLKA